MKYILTLALILVGMNQNSYAQLNELIMQNVKQSADSYEQVLRETKGISDIPRLWIHVRSPEQEKMVNDASPWLKSIKLGEKPIELRPLQSVKTGPHESQLRFFKTLDRNEADQLARKLKHAIPNLQLKDFSLQDQSLDWLKPGHYELWLAPDVSSFDIP